MTNELPTYRAEFPDFPVLPMAARLQHHGFYDSSWHNDACPSWTRTIRTDTEGRDDLQIRVWVEHPDPYKRETGPETPRFIVVVFDQNDDYGAVIETDNFGEALPYALADVITEPGEAPDLFALVMDAVGGETRYDAPDARFNIRIYRWDGEATLIDQLESADRASLNEWYRDHVGYRPDDDSPTPLAGLVRLVAENMLLTHAGAPKRETAEQRTIAQPPAPERNVPLDDEEFRNVRLALMHLVDKFDGKWTEEQLACPKRLLKTKFAE